MSLIKGKVGYDYRMLSMGEKLQLKFKLLTGKSETIEVSQSATVLEVKRTLHTKLPEAPFYRSKLIADGTVLENNKSLSDYPSVKSGCSINVIMQPPWKIYIHDPSSELYEIEIPSDNPKTFTIIELKAHFEKSTGRTLSGLELQFKGNPMLELQASKRVTLGDCGIDKEETIFLVEKGFTQTISNPEVDICFLVDCTGSMGNWIESVKTNVKNIREGLEKQFTDCDLQFAFVRYTDYDQPASSRTTWIDFTKSLTEFRRFVDPISASGGGDTPEDIMGGLKITFSRLKWRESAAKVLIHIADAPCHGQQYHNTSDTYPKGDPAGITHDQMMAEVVRLEIQYFFGYINKDLTDKMIDVFNNSLQKQSSRRLMIRKVEATKPEQITDAAYKSVTASVYAASAKQKK